MYIYAKRMQIYANNTILCKKICDFYIKFAIFALNKHD